MKNYFLVSLLAFLVILTSCGSKDYKVLKQSEISDTNIEDYTTQLQDELKDFKGYKVFKNSDGKNVIIISSGSEGKQLQLSDVKLSSTDTVIEIEKVSEDSTEQNPYIAVELDNIVGAFYVLDTDGNEYTGLGYYE